MGFENFNNSGNISEVEKPADYQEKVKQTRIEKQKQRVEKSWEDISTRFSLLTSKIENLGSSASLSDIRPALMEVINLCEKEINEGKTDKTATLVDGYTDLAKSIGDFQMSLKRFNLDSSKMFTEGSLKLAYNEQIVAQFNEIGNRTEKLAA